MRPGGLPGRFVSKFSTLPTEYVIGALKYEEKYEKFRFLRITMLSY
jgi:hypothetical protein